MIYDEVLRNIQTNKYIACFSYDNYISSKLIQLYLSRGLIRNKTIFDTKEQIQFIQRNLKINEGIDLVSYTNIKDITLTLNALLSKGKDYIVIYHHPVNCAHYFDTSIHIDNKENYTIRDNLQINRPLHVME